MRLVHYHREALARELDDFFRDHGKLLQRGDDDRLSRLQRLLELARGGIDVLDHAECLFELAHRRLQLPVEHAAIGDDHDRVEHPLVGRVVQRRQLVRQPPDGEALAAPRRVLDEVALAGAAGTRIGH
jgi:hypothetical protein